MTKGADLDHTSFAVPDALDWAVRLRRELGAIPIAGEALPEFRYLLLYVGDHHRGARIELLEPHGWGFLTRFLDRSGAGPHHLTFTVSDLADAVRRVRALGLIVAGENHCHPPWREAFIAPDAVHGTVIQLAQSDRSYPTPAQLLATQDRDHSTFPSTEGATDPEWWTPVWDTEPDRSARLGATHLTSTDLGLSRELFAGVLGADLSVAEDELRFTWPSGSLVVRRGDRAGITGMTIEDGPLQELDIGAATLSPRPESITTEKEAPPMIETAQQPAYASVNPATGEVSAEFDFATDGAVDAALDAGAATFLTWRKTPIEERAALTTRIGALFAERADELARIAVEEMGKPLSEAIEEVEFCQSIFGYYGEHGPALAADQPITTFSGDQAVVQKRPVGLLLGVMPWNFPYYQVARFAAPNLVLGNAMLLKHAELVPRCAAAIQRLFDDAGVPAGVYQNVFATYAHVETLIADPRVQGVSLTGSERAGSTIAALAGKHLKKCVLELGGSDPYVVLDSDDVDAAATQAWETRLYNTGQACNSNKRMIVMEDLYEPFVDKLVSLASGLRPGDPTNPSDGTFAPLSSRAALERLKEVVDDAVTHGAKLHVGGEAAEGARAYYSPAVLTGVTPKMRAYREELFGPVAVVYSVSSDEDALRLANDTPYGLGGAVFSTDQGRAARLAAQLDVGMANVNTPAGEGAEIPFGGVKRSGFGRELGQLGMDEFVNKRLFYVKDDATRAEV